MRELSFPYPYVEFGLLSDELDEGKVIRQAGPSSYYRLEETQIPYP